MFCNEQSVVKREPHRAIVAPLRCKRWQCEFCRPMRKRWLRRDVRKGHPIRFLTLTIRAGSQETPDHAARALALQWRNMWRAIKRMFPGKDVAFLCVFERTKKGWPHLHIVLRTPYIEQQWFKKRMQEALDSPVVDIRKIGDIRKAANYVAKYVAKSTAHFQGVKRYWRSLNYFNKPDAKEQKRWDHETPWQRYNTQYHILLSNFAKMRANISQEGDFYVCTFPEHPEYKPRAP